jgi:RNA polymerase sigma-70 factor (ECF subfamily)
MLEAREASPQTPSRSPELGRLPLPRGHAEGLDVLGQEQKEVPWARLGLPGRRQEPEGQSSSALLRGHLRHQGAAAAPENARAPADGLGGPTMPAQTAGSETLAELLPDLRRRALRLTGDPATADDLLQETALRAHRFADTFRPGTCYRAWLFGIMRNQFVTGYRKKRREYEVLERVAAERPALLVQPVANEGEVVDDATSEALAELPEHYRVVLELLAQGLKYREIANKLGCPIGTVMSRINRARHAMLARLGTEGDMAA